MRAISLWQPWASAMTVRRPATGLMLKRIETRGWAPDKAAIGQRIAICASKSQRPPGPDKKPVDLCAWWMEHVKRAGGYRSCFEKAGFTDWETLPFGAVVSHGVLAAVVPTEELLRTELDVDWIEKDWGDYRPGRFGWMFEDMEVLPVPVPIVGRQGIFWWNTEVSHGPSAKNS